jgi:hypothetical protein
MTRHTPTTRLQPEFSSPNAAPSDWAHARAVLDKAQIYWLTTVRPDGRPHVTPLYAVWSDDMLYFCTGETERKARNLNENAHCVVTTGCNVIDGLDVVVEGDARRVRDEGVLTRVAAGYASKYDWHFSVRDGAFHAEEQDALVFRVEPSTIFGFGKGDVFSQTRWRF